MFRSEVRRCRGVGSEVVMLWVWFGLGMADGMVLSCLMIAREVVQSTRSLSGVCWSDCRGPAVKLDNDGRRRGLKDPAISRLIALPLSRLKKES